MGRILDACPGGCGRRNVALCARGVCGACYNRLPDVVAKRGTPAPKPLHRLDVPVADPTPGAPPRAVRGMKVSRLYCPGCGRKDLVPHPLHPTRIPSHVRPARQQKAVRVICKAPT